MTASVLVDDEGGEVLDVLWGQLGAPLGHLGACCRLDAVGDGVDEVRRAQRVRHARKLRDGVESRADATLETRAMAGRAVLGVQARALGRVAWKRSRPGRRGPVGLRRRGAVREG